MIQWNEELYFITYHMTLTYRSLNLKTRFENMHICKCILSVKISIVHNDILVYIIEY